MRGGGAGLVAGGAQVVIVADEALVPAATKIALKETPSVQGLAQFKRTHRRQMKRVSMEGLSEWGFYLNVD